MLPVKKRIQFFLTGLFILVLSGGLLAQNITKFEYFIDTDPGVGLSPTHVNITPTNTVSDLSINVNLGSLTGFHTLYIRSQNDLGEWTHTHFRNFYVVPNVVSPNNITRVEYFFDTDPGAGSATAVAGFAPSTSVINQSIDVDVAAQGLSSGFHIMYVRSQTQDGQWTHTHFRNFYVTKTETGETLVKFEYFFDTDPGFEASGTIAAPITPPSPSVTDQEINAAVSNLALGTHTIYVRAKDSGNEWTQAATATFTVTAGITITQQPVSPLSICEGSTVTISTDATGTTNITYQWQKFNSGTSLFENLVNNITYSGVTTKTLSIANVTSVESGDYRCHIKGDLAPDIFSNTAALTVNAVPLAEITANGTQLTASSGDSYQWYQNGDEVSGATNQSFEFNVLEYGVYVVDVTDNGCTSTSDEFEYLITGTEFTHHNLKIYPNPFTDKLFIESSSQGEIEIQILDGIGKIVKKFSVHTASSLLMDDLAKGMYTIHILQGSKRFYHRIIKE